MTRPRSPRIGVGSGALLLALTSVVVALLLVAVLEYLAGLMLPEPGAPQPEAAIPGDSVSQTLNWLAVSPTPQVPDAELLWRNEPGARRTQPVNPQPFGRQPTWSVEINQEGFRGPERSRNRAADPYRILCIGDSVTFGFNVDQPDAWPRQLLDQLARKYPNREFDVINAGVPGWTWLQGLKFLQARGLALEPDLVVIGHGTNDQFYHAKITDEERFHLLEGFLERNRRRLEQKLGRFNLYRLAQRIGRSSQDSDSRQCLRQIAATGFCRRVPLEDIRAAVEQVSQTVRSAGLDLLVLNTDFLETQAAGASREVADERGITFVDLVAELRERRRADDEARAGRLELAPPMPAESPQASKPGGATRRVVVRVLTADPTVGYRVEATPTVFDAETIDTVLYDDGSHGDEIAGDAVFSAALELPAACEMLEYRFFRDGTPEFEPLPPLPSTLGRRRLQTPASGYGPVDVFGERKFMVEQTHPDREGNEVIASLIAERLASFPSFVRFLNERAE